MNFTQRQLTASLTLGQRLQQLRDEAGLSVDELAKKLQIAPKYIEAIEAGQYSALPGHVYARNFVRQYAQFFDLHLEAAMERFDHEYHVVAKTTTSPRRLPPERVSTEHPWIRRHFRMLAASVVVLLVLGYVGFQAYRIYTPPKLIVSQPTGDLTTSENQVRVSGQTELPANVAINGQTVAVSANGQFSELVDVSAGLNTLRITSKKKHSQERVITRQILVEQL